MTKGIAEDSVSFKPAIGEYLAVPKGQSSIDLYATAVEDVKLFARLSDSRSIQFVPIEVTSITTKLFTYKATVSIESSTRVSYTIAKDGEEISLPGEASLLVQKISDPQVNDHTRIITLDEGEDLKSVKLSNVSVKDWEGWAWQRPRPTWVEARYTSLDKLDPLISSHMLLLQPTTDKIDPTSTLCIYPCSSGNLFINITGAREGEEEGLYVRARRATTEQKKISAYVTFKTTFDKKSMEAVQGAIELAKDAYGISSVKYVEARPRNDNFYDRMGFCTWSSIGEGVMLTRENLGDLINTLRKENLPVGSFIIDDGWQNIEQDHNGAVGSRGLYGFDSWAGMDGTLKDIVSLIKDGLPTIKDVGVWMTLHGYWNSIASNSKLIEQYEMKPYQLSRDSVLGMDWPDQGFDGQQSGTIGEEHNRIWYLPPPHLAYKFWKDYFQHCADSGVTFAKVDDQAYGSFLQGSIGAELFVALWNGMTKAADEVFGKGTVIHCMAHYERWFNGDIGLGVASNGTKVVFRNTDDFGLDRPNIHRDHIQHNIFNAMLTSNLCIIPDADMFMTSAQWPDYHSALRAFFIGPLMLADKPGNYNHMRINKLLGYDKSGQAHVVKAAKTVQPLSRSIWEPTLSGGVGPSIKGKSYFPASQSASIILWSSRDGAHNSSLDLLFTSDLTEALETLPSSGKLGVWYSSSKQAQILHASQTQFPVAAVELKPETCDVVTVAPVHKVGSNEIACLGLLDKYAGLAAISNIKTTESEISVDVQFAGSLGFLVPNGQAFNAVVDGSVVKAQTEKINNEISLITIPLRTKEKNSESSAWGIRLGAAN